MSTAMRAHFAIQITKTVIEYLLKWVGWLVAMAAVKEVMVTVIAMVIAAGYEDGGSA